jgi:hypothetical protein
MPAPKSDFDVTVGLTSANTYCTYRSFKNPKKLDESITGDRPYVATCGFNQDPLFYCPPQQGDLPVSTV